MLFDQVPAARAHQQGRQVFAELIVLALRVCETDRADDGVAEIDLAFEIVVPSRRMGVLKVGHEDTRARVKSVDDHLAVDRAGDLDAAVL